ncbi:MAG: hypothetical protein OXC96_08780 [Cyanobacteria bacterium MAG CAR1_bin_15]|nr:hypothetical protein [Cyanobacteria bacterium MAG CAR1_bin_15]
MGAQAHHQPADGRMGLDGLPIDGGREGLSLTTTADALPVETTSKETTGLDAGNATISRLPIALAVGIRQDRGGDAETGCGMDIGPPSSGMTRSRAWPAPSPAQPNQAGTLPLPTSHHGHQCSRGHDALLQPVAMEQGAGATGTGAT